MTDLIHIQPTRARRTAFAQWGTAQTPKVRTVGINTFAVPAELFVQAPEDVLVGALVDGRRYVSPDEDAATGRPAPGRLLSCGLCHEEDGQEVHPHPECSLGTDPALHGFHEAVAGDVLPEVPASAYGPDSVLLPPAGEEETGPFACDLCTRDYSTARGRDMHRRQKHPEATHAG